MYFDPEPKEKKADIYNFQKEYETIKTAINGRDRIIVLKGLRRTGKTSLMKVAYNELHGPKCFIDSRIVEPKQTTVNSTIVESITKTITENYLDMKAKEIFQSLNIGILGVKISLKKEKTPSIFSNIDKILEKKKDRLVVFIDEVQKIKGGNISGIIAHLFEHTKNIKFVLAGSEIGLLDEVIGTEAESDLYGRVKKVIQIKKLGEDGSKKFLRMGFKQARKKITEDELTEIVKKIDGVVGWLTLFGYYAIEQGIEEGIKITIQEGAKITANEIENFLKIRSIAKYRYLSVLEGCISGLRWIEIKRLLEAKTGVGMNDRVVGKYLDELEKYGFIIKENKKYLVADPMIKEGLRLLTGSK